MEEECRGRGRMRQNEGVMLDDGERGVPGEDRVVCGEEVHHIIHPGSQWWTE